MVRAIENEDVVALVQGDSEEYASDSKERSPPIDAFAGTPSKKWILLSVAIGCVVALCAFAAWAPGGGFGTVPGSVEKRVVQFAANEKWDWVRILNCEYKKYGSRFDAPAGSGTPRTPEEIMKMAEGATQVAVCSKGEFPFDCAFSKPNTFPIARLRKGQTITDKCDDNCAKEVWTGGRAASMIASCDHEAAEGALTGNKKMFDACNNRGGILFETNGGYDGKGKCGWNFYGNEKLDIFINQKIESTGAKAEPPKDYPNIDLITRGYNLYESDSCPKDANMDPGLKKPVFALEYTSGGVTGDRRHNVPDGYHATVDFGCATTFTTKTARDEYEYSAMNSQEVTLHARAEVNMKFPPAGKKAASKAPTAKGSKFKPGIGGKLFARAGGQVSAGFKSASSTGEFRESQMSRSTAKCATYVAAIDFGDMPKTHPDFQAAVDGLGTDKEKYWDLFDKFGTHFLSLIKMGARYGVSSYFKKTDFDEMSRSAETMGVGADFSVGTVAKATVGKNGVKKALKKGFGMGVKGEVVTSKAQTLVNKYLQKSEKCVVGPELKDEEDALDVWISETKKNPVPYKFDYRMMCEHPAFEGPESLEACIDALGGYCDGRLKARGAHCAIPKETECRYDADCEDDQACVQYACKPLPVCSVTVHSGSGFGGSKHELPRVTILDAPEGRFFKLNNGDVKNNIKSVKLSDGCNKVELADDDSPCLLGRGNNGLYYKSASSLPGDLQNDVCMVKVWAKDTPRDGVELAEETQNKPWWEIPELVQEGRRLTAGNVTSLGGVGGLLEGGGRDAGDVVGKVAPAEVDGFLASGGAGGELPHEIPAPARRLQEGQSYIKNVGKAMYGYNHFFGAPMSAEYAGTDPGFQHRAIWEDTYELGTVAASVEFSAVPGGMKGDESYFGRPEKDWGALWGIAEFETNSAGECARRCADQLGCMQYIWRHEIKIIGMPAEGYKFICSLQPTSGFTNEYKKYNKYFGGASPALLPPEEPMCSPYGIEVTVDIWKGLWKPDEADRQKSYHEVGKGLPNIDGEKQGPVKFIGERCKKGTIQWKALEILKCSSSNKDDCSLTLQQSIDQGASIRPFGGCGGRPDLYGAEHLPTTCSESGQGFTVVMRIAHDYSATTSSGVNVQLLVNNEWTKDAVLQGKFGDAKFGTMRSRDYVLSAWPTKVRLNKTAMGGDLGIKSLEVFSGKRPNFVERASILDCPELVCKGDEKYWIKTDFAKYDWTVKEYDIPLEKENVEQLKPMSGYMVPDGWQIQKAKRSFCEKDFTTRTTGSEFQYRKDTSTSFNPGGFRLDFGKFSFGLSYEKKEFRESNGKERKLMTNSMAECVDYVMEMDDLDLSPPPTNKAFQFVVDSAEEAMDFYELFDMYGLHFPKKVVFGSRYGITTYIDESSYESRYHKSSSLKLDVEVCQGVKASKGLAVEVCGGVKYGNKDGEKAKETMSKFFQNTKEFFVGKRFPDEGGVDAWMEASAEEPMPIKFDLIPICQHPAFKGEKRDKCSKFHSSYCEEHLSRANGDVECGESETVPDCTFDLDCADNYKCTPDRRCMKEPACIVDVYSQRYLKGEKRSWGPVYRRSSEKGAYFKVGGSARSVAISGGCEEVVFMDQDEDNEDYRDNLVLTNRNSNKPVSNNFKYGVFKCDLCDDISRIKVTAKEKFV